MSKNTNTQVYTINDIETILKSYRDLERKSIIKLITLLNRKHMKRYSVESKEKDKRKTLRKYYNRGGNECKEK